MTKDIKDMNDPAGVTACIEKLEPAFAKLVQTVRALILKTDKSIGEQIKWNAPSFFYTGEMKPFNPKEYRRDIVVMNLRKGVVILIFPTGLRIKDTTGLLEGDYTDGRRLVTLKTPDELKSKGKDLQKVIKDWLNTVE